MSCARGDGQSHRERYLESLSNVHHERPQIDQPPSQRSIKVPEHKWKESNVDDFMAQDRAQMKEEAQDSIDSSLANRGCVLE